MSSDRVRSFYKKKLTAIILYRAIFYIVKCNSNYKLKNKTTVLLTDRKIRRHANEKTANSPILIKFCFPPPPLSNHHVNIPDNSNSTAFCTLALSSFPSVIM